MANLVVDLGKSVDVVVVPETKETYTQVEIVEVTDNPIDRTVVVRLKQSPFILTLWQGDAYDTIGQWTDTDVTNAIKAYYVK